MVHRKQPGNGKKEKKTAFSRLPSIQEAPRGARYRPADCYGGRRSDGRIRKGAMMAFGRFPLIEERLRFLEPKGPPACRVQAEKLSKMTTIVCWDLAPNVTYSQVKDLFHAIGGVVGISLSNTRCRAVVDFATAKDAHMALCQLTGRCLLGRSLKFAWFDKNSCDIDRDTLPLMKLLPGRVSRTVCVEGFDASQSIAQIICMLKARFDLGGLRGGQIITPENPDGTSTGKAFISFRGGISFAIALQQDGLDLGDGHKLYVTKWLELLNFPMA